MHSHIRGVPEHLRAFCQLCPHEADSLDAIVDHLEQEHGHTAERWPDGGLVVDASDVPELIGGEA